MGWGWSGSWILDPGLLVEAVKLGLERNQVLVFVVQREARGQTLERSGGRNVVEGERKVRVKETSYSTEARCLKGSFSSCPSWGHK